MKILLLSKRSLPVSVATALQDMFTNVTVVRMIDKSYDTCTLQKAIKNCNVIVVGKDYLNTVMDTVLRLTQTKPIIIPKPCTDDEWQCISPS